MVTISGGEVYEEPDGRYKQCVPGHFTIGDVIRKARMARKWNQERLGEEAAHYRLRPADVRVNKATVSKVETDPMTSELGTVWRLLAALDLTFADVEKRVGPPFIRPGEATVPTKRRRQVG